MADKVVAMAASDLFSLHANFKEQGSTTRTILDFSQVADANGDVGGGCEDAGSNSRLEYTGNYKYCGTDIVSDAGVLLSTFGEVMNSKAVTEAVFEFSQEAQIMLALTGHQHGDNTHEAQNNFDCSATTIIPATTGGIGVPAFVSDAGTNSSPRRATLRISVEHDDAQDSANAHWVGNNKNCRIDLSIEYIGTPSLTTTGWKVDSAGADDSNSEFDTYAIEMHKYITRISA